MDFKEKVLKLTRKVPKSKVTTYKIIAEKLGTKAYRAVGSALRHNEIPIIIPCHRVVNSDGSVGGYAGKSNSRKKIELLMKEGVEINKNKVNLLNYLYRF